MTTLRYKVVREQYGVPCSHPSCPILHAHLANVEYETPQQVRSYLPNGASISLKVRRWHEVTRTGWYVIDTQTGERAGTGEEYQLKRDAMVEMNRLTKELRGAR